MWLKCENIENIRYFPSWKYRIYIGYISYIIDIYHANPGQVCNPICQVAPRWVSY